LVDVPGTHYARRAKSKARPVAGLVDEPDAVR